MQGIVGLKFLTKFFKTNKIQKASAFTNQCITAVARSGVMQIICTHHSTISLLSPVIISNYLES